MTLLTLVRRQLRDMRWSLACSVLAFFGLAVLWNWGVSTNQFPPPEARGAATGGGADLPPTLDVDELETWAIRKALQQTGGNVSQAARVLGMSRDTLHTKLKKKGIDREAVLQASAAGD